MKSPGSGKGLLLVMIDVDPEEEAELNSWYDEEHIKERLGVPGFIRARRFMAVEGKPKYLALYDVENPEVLQSPEYLYRLHEGETDRTNRMMKKLKTFVRNVYVEISDESANTPEE